MNREMGYKISVGRVGEGHMYDGLCAFASSLGLKTFQL